MRGNKRKIVTLGTFPTLSPAEARRKAVTLSADATPPDKALPSLDLCVSDYLRHLEATPRWIKEQERLFRNHVISLHGELLVD